MHLASSSQGQPPEAINFVESCSLVTNTALPAWLELWFRKVSSLRGDAMEGSMEASLVINKSELIKQFLKFSYVLGRVPASKPVFLVPSGQILVKI